MDKKRTSTNRRFGIALLREKLIHAQNAPTLTEARSLAADCLALVDEIHLPRSAKKRPEPEPSPRCQCGCGRVANICIVGRWWYSQECHKRKLGLL